MTTGSLILLVFFLFWGIAVLLLFCMNNGKDLDVRERLQAFLIYIAQHFPGCAYGSRQPAKAAAGAEEQQCVLMVMTLKLGYLLFAVTIFRLVLAPDLLTLALTVLCLFAFIGGQLLLTGFSSSGLNWQHLYELDSDYGVLEITLTADGPGKEWIGSTLAELNLRKRELLVLAIIRNNKFTVFPKGPEILTAGDRVLVFGKYPPFGFGSSVESSAEQSSALREPIE
ncbi:MAG TPA: TrkA C-terminal domain-containing protein [Bacillota bacterium]